MTRDVSQRLRAPGVDVRALDAAGGSPTFSMVAAQSFSARPASMGLDAELSLDGGSDSDLRRIRRELGFGWQHELLAVVGGAVARAMSGEARWFTLPPMLLEGPAGVGRTHVARRLAQLAGVPHAMLDLSAPGAIEQLGQRPRGPDLVMPSVPVLAMAISRCANPMISVVGANRLDEAGQRFFALMIDPDTAARWVEDAVGATVDLRQVSWIVQADAGGMLSPSLARQLRPVGLRWPDPGAESLHFAEVIAEAAIDECVHGFTGAQIAAAMDTLARRTGQRSTASLYEAACMAVASRN